MSAYMPIGPLLELCPHLTAGAIADLAGLDRSGFNRAIGQGRLRWDAADLAAIRLGSHPAVIWPDEWIDETNRRSHGARRYLARIAREVTA